MDALTESVQALEERFPDAGGEGFVGLWEDTGLQAQIPILLAVLRELDAIRLLLQEPNPRARA